MRLDVSRNIGLVATVSARALKVAGISLMVFFHQLGMSPQRMGIRSRLPPRSMIASMVSDVVPRWQIALGLQRHITNLDLDLANDGILSARK